MRPMVVLVQHFPDGIQALLGKANDFRLRYTPKR
jgi:hypothetical protein